ncbi:uncharacterized protein LOC105643590 isoform X2 [Jatropha curcas]|uniref:uncharacterized protein LOC105643590 isoform X2 n=1 Tax=Jatropha curcas TaxID=180498 RepID=UPI0009D76F39|nr:uncharacterized protein LOC105643590 isoform X2 [Jatropha curcas]
MEKDCTLSTPSPKRQSIKIQSHFNTYPLWKDKFRENCFKRIREDRNRLLWKMRLPTTKSLPEKDFIKSAFQDIVSEELERMKHSSLDEHLKIPTSAPDASDILWEYDGLHDTYQGECEEILLEMQQIFYENIRADSTRKEPENYIETWEDEEDEYLARAVYEHMQLNDKQISDYDARCTRKPGVPSVSKGNCKRAINLYTAIFVNLNSAKAMRLIWTSCRLVWQKHTQNILIGVVYRNPSFLWKIDLV